MNEPVEEQPHKRSLGVRILRGLVWTFGIFVLLLIVVLSGLTEGERVVTGDTFVLDAERRLRVAQGKSEEIVE